MSVASGPAADLTVAIVEGGGAGREFAVAHDKVLLLGRDPASDVVITDEEVSSRHASLTRGADGIEIEDLGSTNGTFVNGDRVTAVHRLKVGDRIKLGATVLEVRGPVPSAPAEPSPPAAPSAPAPSPPAEPSPPAAASTPVTGEERLGPPGMQLTRARQIPTVPMLVFVDGELAGTAVPAGTQVVIGRDPGIADVILAQDTDVSRRHATFSPSGDGLTVQDLGSTNGTFVNGRRITEAVTLVTGDQVQVGGTRIDVLISGQRVIAPAAAPKPAAPGAPTNDIVVEGLVKQFGDYRAVDGISLHVDPGEIYGFLGPNGAGKSTTVHMLTTLLPPTGGVARVAGFDVATQGDQVRATIGVALQAAALDPNLNAWEHMDLQTALQGLPKSKRKARGQELIERVGLTYAADRRVGGYSGGMKRRLDLALALVHWPQVLFLDEPTTGLDPQSRTALWEEVARLVSEEGMTVFLTTQYLEEADVLADRVGIIDHGEIVAEDTPERLKAEIGRPTVEVVPVNSNEWTAVSEVLSRFGELVTGSQRGVAVRLRPGAEELADIIRALDSQGLRVANVQLHAPSLDDVFLAKTGRSLEGAGEDAETPEEGVLEQISASGVAGPTPVGPTS